MASQLDGIGWEKAKKIGEKYGTVADLVEAREKALMEIEGIGKKLAEGIVKQLGRSG